MTWVLPIHNPDLHTLPKISFLYFIKPGGNVGSKFLSNFLIGREKLSIVLILHFDWISF